MSNSKVVRELTEKLKPILRDGADVKSSTLLRAYATFAAMEHAETESVAAAYEALCKSEICPRFVILPIAPFADELAIRAALQAFRRYSVEEFLRFIMSDLIADASGLIQFYRNELDSDILLLTRYLIQVRLLLYPGAESGEMDVYEDGTVHPDNPSLLRLFHRYCAREPDTSARLNYSQFESLYRCVNVFPIRFDEQTIRPVGYKKEDLNRALDILYNQLELSRAQQVELCYRYYIQNKQARRFQSDEKLFRFFKLKDGLARRKLFSTALSIFATIPPAEALAAISVRRRTHDNGGEQFSERIFTPNDVPLENSLIYPLFTSSVGPVVRDEQQGVTILLPSVFFVLKWLADPMLAQQRVCFVFRSDYESGIFHYHFSEGTYGQANLNIVSFTDLATWKEELRTGRRSMEGEKLLAFFCGVSVEEQSDVYRLLYERAQKMELFLVLGSYALERARSPFSVALGDPRFRFRSIELVPQGINNSAIPRRKMLVTAELLNQPPQNTEPVTITADTLNIDLKTQAVVRGTIPPV